MQANSQYEIYDPFNPKDHEPKRVGAHPRISNSLAYSLIDQIVEHNQKLGKKGAECFSVIAIMRSNPKRWLRMNLMTLTPKMRNEQRRLPGPDYQGALSFAESLLENRWRIASPVEEAACIKADEAETAAVVNAIATKNKPQVENHFHMDTAAVAKELAKEMATAKK